MKLVHVELDGFGVWNGLALKNLSPDCTVFYGLNEAGKTTLLEFLRGVLYGYTPTRRARYLPPVHGGSPGGVLTVSSAQDGQLRIGRRPSGDELIGTVTVEAADGRIQGEAHLGRLLSGVDEPTFENIFAVGLRELQELGTLNDLEAARLLYELTAGMDRVSIIDVMRELARSREDIIGDGSESSPIGRLVARRDRLKQDIRALADLSGRYAQLLADRSSCEQKSAQLEETLAAGEAECRTLEVAALVCDAWHRREELKAQIRAYGAAEGWSQNAPERMERLCLSIRRLKASARRLAVKRRRRRNELSQIKLNDAIWRQSARIAALVENEPWVTSLEQAIEQAEETVRQLTAQYKACGEPVEIVWQPGRQSQTVGPVSHADEQIWRRLRRRASALARSRKRFKAARHRVEQNRVAAGGTSEEVKRALAARKQTDLTSAIDAAGNHVSQLRNRIQVEDRLAQLSQTKTDVQQQILDLSERQILPPWTLAALGGVFVLGMVLILSGLLLPTSFTGSIGWSMAWLGLLGTGSAIAAKFTMERSMARQLDVARKQLELVESQTASANRQGEELDAALSKSSLSLGARLEAAQRELSELEKLLPLDAQRQSAQQEADRNQAVLSGLRQKHARARQHWRQALASVGLADSLNPRQAKEKLAVFGKLKTIQRQLADAQAELDRRRQELAAVAAHVSQVFEASRIEPASIQLTQRLRQLRHDLSAQESLHQERDTLRRRLRKLRQRRQLVYRRLGVLRHRRGRLLKRCGAASLADFRRRAAEFSRAATLIQERNTLTRDIEAVLQGIPEPGIAAAVAGRTPRQVEDKLTTKRHDCQQIRSELRQVVERVGELSQQIRQLAGDRPVAAKRFALGQLESQLADLTHEARVLSVTSRVLERVKATYERDRQPETLLEASEYLSQLTAGRYVRVWTRLGQNVLLVDDAEGHSLSIEVLSHGTREQLFLSLRLALVGLFARRGIVLPLILDDVLVNFDAVRAKAAIGVLHDFSKRGHQVLMLTCHEHIAGLCLSNEMDVRRLPDHRDGNREHTLEIDVHPQPKKHPARKAKELAPVALTEATLSLTPTETLALRPTYVRPAPTIRPLPPTDESNGSRPLHQLISHLRIDLPEAPTRPPAIMRRWEAEELCGALGERANPLWVLGSNQTTIGTQTIVGSTSATPDAVALPAMAPRRRRRLSAHWPGLVELSLGDEDWDL
jgi:uncharacterized protein YhaN